MERARIEGRAFFFLQQECELLVESIDYAAKALNSSRLPGRVEAFMARILVVDDEKPLAETLATILRMNNYEVQVAHDGVEGYNAAALFAPNLIISDVAMPNRNGVEMAIEIRRDLPGIQILLISGQATSVGLLEAARQRGYDFECLAKPIHPLDLLSKIATLLARSAAAKQAS